MRTFVKGPGDVEEDGATEKVKGGELAGRLF